MAKKPPTKKPDKDHEKAKELGISHRKGHVVHAGISVKGGAGYKGKVIKIDDNHTWIKIGEGKFGDRIVKAPHRLVTKEEVEMSVKKKNIVKDYDDETKRLHKKNEIQKKIIDEGLRMVYGMHSEETDWDSSTKTEREVSHYNVVHKESGRVVGKASTKKRARTSVDKHDNAYGSYAHTFKPVFKEEFEDHEMTKLTEAKDATGCKLFHKHYSSAIQHALDHHEKTSGLKVDPDDVFHHISVGPSKPQPGMTVSHNIPATKEGRNGVEHHMIHMQIYNRDNPTTRDVQEPYELNTYSGKMPRQKKMHEETEMNEGSTYGVSTPLRKAGQHVSENGRHVAKVKRDKDWDEYRVELHTDGKHVKKADSHHSDKEDAHETAKAMVAHAQKHEKPLKEDAIDEAEGFMRHIKVGEKVRLTNPKAPARHTVDNIKGQKVDITKDSGQKVTMPLNRIKKVKFRASQYNKEDVLREDALVSKIINKYIT